jgi:serine/threonine protein kinase
LGAQALYKGHSDAPVSLARGYCWRHVQHASGECGGARRASSRRSVRSHHTTRQDVWSIACVAYELATGDLLFDPRAEEGYDKNDDHLALMIERLGRPPKVIVEGGEYSRKFFNRRLECVAWRGVAWRGVAWRGVAWRGVAWRGVAGASASLRPSPRSPRGELKAIKALHPHRLDDRIVRKYNWPRATASAFVDFLLPMLRLDPAKRATAGEMLLHEFLADTKVPDNFERLRQSQDIERRAGNLSARLSVRGDDSNSELERDIAKRPEGAGVVCVKRTPGAAAAPPIETAKRAALKDWLADASAALDNVMA